MAFKAQDVINQLKRNGVKIDSSTEKELLQHLSNPELVQKIKQGAKQWQFPEHNVALTSAITFLGNKGFDPALMHSLHTINSHEMEKIHNAGTIRGRAATALKAAAKREASSMYRRRAA